MLNRGALASAIGRIIAGMLQQSVSYTSDREQFGRAIGANQAVKHLLADVAVQVEYAKPVIYRAAYAGVSPRGRILPCRTPSRRRGERHC